jgi:cytochrome b
MDNASRQTPHSVHVWDPFVRLFHWGLVLCVSLNLFILEDGETPHQWTGYAACLLIVARFVWGFIGSRHARFSDFFPTPARLMAHITHMVSGNKPHYIGHNPLGALMMFLLLLLVLSLGLTGWLQTTDMFWGDEWLQEVHELLSNALLAAAGMHALAAIIMGRIEKVGLIRAMFSGVKVFR